MSEIIVEVEFTDSIGGSFRGSISELIKETYRRSMILGTTSYRLVSKPTILYLIEEDDEI